mgnify:CR=1 FL=1
MNAARCFLTVARGSANLKGGYGLGGRVIEVKGENKAAKAADLAAKLTEAVGSMGVTLTSP